MESHLDVTWKFMKAGHNFMAIYRLANGWWVVCCGKGNGGLGMWNICPVLSTQHSSPAFFQHPNILLGNYLPYYVQSCWESESRHHWRLLQLISFWKLPGVAKGWYVNYIQPIRPSFQGPWISGHVIQRLKRKRTFQGWHIRGRPSESASENLWTYLSPRSPKQGSCDLPIVSNEFAFRRT